MKGNRNIELPSESHELQKIYKNSGWFMAFGSLMIILGIASITTSLFSSTFPVFLFAILLICMGITQLIQTSLARHWRGLLVSLLLGILYTVTGFMLIAKPTAAIESITFWIAAFCFIAGSFRMLTSLLLRFDQWKWMFFNGLITFILGIMIFTDWPKSGLWIIGIFIGVDMILSGWSWLLLGLFSRHYVK